MIGYVLFIGWILFLFTIILLGAYGNYRYEQQQRRPPHWDEEGKP